MTHRKMDQEIASGAETELTAPVAEETEVATPEPADEVAQESESTERAEKTPEQKEIERLRRQLTKRDRTQGKLHQELEQLRTQSQQQPERQEPKETDPVALAREIALVEKVTEKSNQIAREGQKKFTDFNDALKTIAEELGPLFDQRGRPAPVMEAVLDSDKPADLLHFLGKNPDLAAELEGLSSTAIGRRIARIEAQMSEQAKPKTSAAPKPLEPVKGQGVSKDPSKMTDAEFNAWRKAQIAQRR